MKRVTTILLTVIFACGPLLLVKACGFDRGDGEQKVGGARGHLIPGREERGFDPVLEDKMERYFLAYKTFSTAPFGMRLDAYVASQTDRQVIERFVNQNPDRLSFEDFCALDPACPAGLGVYQQIDGSTVVEEGLVKSMGGYGDLGLCGGEASAVEFFRYAVLRDQGYPEPLVTEARERCIQLIKVLHIAHTIHGFPGYMVRGLKPKSMPPYEVLYGFTVGGEPYPKQKDNTMRDDMSGLYPEWSWMDSASTDQFDGWLLLTGVAWDVVRDDPYVPQYLKDWMVEDARATGDMLMAISPESGTDLLIRDADGRLTRYCDANANVVSYGAAGCPEFAVADKPMITFNAILGLSFTRVLYHVTGDEKLRAFYYDELIAKRQWHKFLFESPWTMSDMGYATNFSNVNMMFIAYYNAIRYESDPAVRASLQGSLEQVLWDNGGIRQPREMRQSFYDFIYAALRANGTPEAVVQSGLETLKEWPEPPNFNDPVINCDADEIAQGWCLAVDNQTIIELPPPEFRFAGGGLVAEHVVPRRLRGNAGFEWTASPYDVNRDGDGLRLNANGEVLTAYWMGRYLNRGNSPARNISPIARAPEAPTTPLSLAATAVSESQINLVWTDPDHREAEFLIERRIFPDGQFAPSATVKMDVQTFSDAGLAPNTAYEYRVRGQNKLGASSFSNSTAAATFPAPAQSPASAVALVAAALDHQSIHLAWDDLADNEIGFKIMRSDVGMVAETLANVTEFTDTNLSDDTTYTYVIVAYNSAGNAWPSNDAWAATDKLPSIFAIAPTQNAFQVPIGIGQVQVGFGDPVLPADVQFELRDEVGPVDGTWSLDGAGTILTFIPDPLLLTMSTTYTVKVIVGPVTFTNTFNTEGADQTVNIDNAVGKAFALSIFDSEIVEPAAAKDLLSGLGLEVYLILGVLSADSTQNQMQIIGAIGDMAEGADHRVQDETLATLLFAAPASTDGNPAWTLGPVDLPINVEGFQLSLRDVTLSGVFEENYAYSGKGEFRGGLDLRPLAVLTGLDPAELCLTLGVCAGCPGDPTRLECVNLYLRNMRADRNAVPVKPIAQVVPTDLGGATDHTVELALTHPATGAPEPGVDIKVTVTGGNGQVNGGATATVTTGLDGKATVVISDSDAGADELEIEIVSPVGYSWVKAKLNVVF